jgi:hypothetical protein
MPQCKKAGTSHKAPSAIARTILVPHRPFDSRRIGCPLNRIEFVGAASMLCNHTQWCGPPPPDGALMCECRRWRRRFVNIKRGRRAEFINSRIVGHSEITKENDLAHTSSIRDFEVIWCGRQFPKFPRGFLLAVTPPIHCLNVLRWSSLRDPPIPSRVNMIGHDVAIVGERYLANGSSTMFDWSDSERCSARAGLKYPK